ncbi:MAG TPA: glycosyltransferase family 4 protein [Nitrososphaera sp.]|nr:glycosyltransferase family 4 protein [Nitrososphaera sp.]
MKVVFVTYDSDNDVGGVSSWLQRLLPWLQATGVEVEVHVLAFGGRPGINCARFAKERIPFRWRPWEEDTRRAVRSCLKLIEDSQPDIYVPNCIVPAYYAAGYVRSQGVYTVGVLHSDDPFHWGLVDEFVNGLSAFRLSAVVTVSKFIQEAVEKSTKKHKLISRQIAYGVPIPDEVVKPPNGVFRLVYTGRLEEKQKCISEVTRALCSVVNQNSGVEAWIVGEGSARANVERILETSEVDRQRIRLLGRVDVSRIYSVLRDCHALVLLSDYEGLPVSMLEAMAVGVVPICLDVRSGIRDAIQPGFNGFIVKDRKDDFHAAVQTLQKDGVLWSKLSANARETVKQRFSEETCAALWVELLRSFSERRHTCRVKSPFFIRLPRRNPKFGYYDQRPLPLIKYWSRLRRSLGYYKRKMLKSFCGAFYKE